MTAAGYGDQAVAPNAPTVTVTPGNNQASIAWVDGFNGGSAITGHKIYRASVNGFIPGPGNLIATVSGPSPYVDTGVSNGSTYYYRVIAVNAKGDSVASNQDSALPAPAAPAAPTITVTPGAGSISIAWVDGSNGGSAITSHRVYRSTTADFTPGSSNLIASPTADSPYVDNGVTAGTTYYYKVVAVNVTGPSLASNQGSGAASAAPTAPAAPTVVVTPGNGQNSIAWTDGATGGSAITGHKIYRSTTSGFTPGSGNLIASPLGASPYVDGGLTVGTTYYYRVVAVNAIGDSVASSQASGAPTAAAPAAPDITVTASRNSSI